MKKLICMVALATFSFASVYAHGTYSANQQTQTDTTKTKKKGQKGKMKKRMKRDTTMTDTSKMRTPAKK